MVVLLVSRFHESQVGCRGQSWSYTLYFSRHTPCNMGNQYTYSQHTVLDRSNHMDSTTIGICSQCKTLPSSQPLHCSIWWPAHSTIPTVPPLKASFWAAFCQEQSSPPPDRSTRCIAPDSLTLIIFGTHKLLNHDKMVILSEVHQHMSVITNIKNSLQVGKDQAASPRVGLYFIIFLKANIEFPF